MLTKYYRITTLEDAILKTGGGTQGNSSSLDYVSGRINLGISSKKYDDFADPFMVFHSGKVQFGNAYPEINQQRSLPMPLSWFHIKGQSFQENGNLISENIFTDETNKQTKQIRGSFFTVDGKTTSLKKQLTLKSAHERKKRRSADNLMFAYQSIAAGTSWIFYIKSEDHEALEQLENVLLDNDGKHSIGKSKSAQYGYVKIEKYKYQENVVENLEWKDDDNHIFLYAESDLALFDKYGQPCLLCNSLTERMYDESPVLPGKIIWEKSHTRSHVFTPWNNIRDGRDADRICISKGSVICLKVDESFSGEEWRKNNPMGIGGYLSEGMGKVLLNPCFLISTENSHPTFKTELALEINDSTASLIIQEKDPSDDKIISWLTNKTNEEQIILDIYRRVNAFTSKNEERFGSISASQWSCIRNLVVNETSYRRIMEKLFAKETGFLMHGKMSRKWQEKKRSFVLSEEIESFQSKHGEKHVAAFVNRLSQQMAEIAEKQEQRG